MFHSKPVDDLVKTDQVMNDEPVGLSVLALDLPAPVEGWATYLNSRGIEIVTDDIGRQAIARDDARLLFVERAENEVRQAALRAAAEQRAVEADQLWRAQLYAGIPAAAVPDGVHPSAAMLQAAYDNRPGRWLSVLEEALAGESATFHPLGPTEE